MPPLPPAVNVLKITLKYIVDTDSDVINRFYIKWQGTPPSNSVLSTFAGSVSTSWLANMAPLHSASVQLNLVDVVDLTKDDAGRGSNNAVRVGTRAGTQLSAGTAALLDMHIQRRYRGGKPRIYLPAGTSSDLQNRQTWTSAFTGALQTAWNTWINAILASPPSGTSLLNLVNVSYYKGFTVHTGPTGRASNIPTLRGVPIVDDVSQVLVDPRVASQRRRGRP